MTDLTNFFVLFAGEATDPITQYLMYMMCLVASFILMIGIIDIFYTVGRIFKR